MSFSCIYEHLAVCVCLSTLQLIICPVFDDVSWSEKQPDTDYALTFLLILIFQAVVSAPKRLGLMNNYHYDSV